MTPELTAQIAVWRQKAIEGTLSLEDTKAAIIALRQGRESAATSSVKKTKAKAVLPSADDLLSELSGL